MKEKKLKIIIAISGGVDSSVSAWLLKQKGYEVIGVFMRLEKNQQESEEDARRVCNFLDIRFYPVNISDKFESEVMDYFVKSYKDGITPNPCVRCNKLIKFGELFRVMNDLDADCLATGHYVRIKRAIKNSPLEKGGANATGCVKVLKGLDNNKDQTYFLYNLHQDQLSRIMFPVGNMSKSEVYKIADENKIPYSKKESQDVCFLVKEGQIVDHNDYLKKKINLKPGPIKTMDEKVIGEHIGLPFYTIGQRRGIDVGGTGPYYAAKMDYKTNTLYVVNDPNDKALFGDEFMIDNVNMISGGSVENLKCEAVIRYRFKPVACKVERIKNSDEYKVKLNEPQRAITSGQSVVFYDGDELLGGGVIK